MSSRARIALVVVAAAVVVVAFVLASGGDDGGGQSDDPPVTQSAASTEPAAATDTGAATTPAGTTPAQTSTTPAPAPPVATVVVVGGKPQGGVQRLEFDKGDTIRFRVRSDVADEVHVHGYDIARDVAAGGSVTFSFPATIDGRFEVELESRAEQIAQLEVQP